MCIYPSNSISVLGVSHKILLNSYLNSIAPINIILSMSNEILIRKLLSYLNPN